MLFVVCDFYFFLVSGGFDQWWSNSIYLLFTLVRLTNKNFAALENLDSLKVTISVQFSGQLAQKYTKQDVGALPKG